ncbi:MAG: hypothetical protein EB060_04670 [Proteobacteria bacterium]|nr:hypothetical protein [Pseudomonadota bacterium]
MGILDDHRLSFGDISELTEPTTTLYQLHEDSPTFLRYFGDMREAASLHRRDNIFGIEIKKVADLAGLVQCLHKIMIGMTSDTAALLDRSRLAASHPMIDQSITAFEGAVRGFRQHVRMFTNPELIPQATRKELEAKAEEAVKGILPIRALASIPIHFTVDGQEKQALVRQPPMSDDWGQCPGMVMIALQYAARGGIVDRHRAPTAVQDFFSRTVGVAKDTADRREALAGMVRKTLSGKPYKLTQEQLEQAVPDLLSEVDHRAVITSTRNFPAQKRNFLLKLIPLATEEGYDVLADWMRISLEESGELQDPTKVRPQTAQEAVILTTFLHHLAQMHEKFDHQNVIPKDLQTALDETYKDRSDTASLMAFGQDARLPLLLAEIKPFLEPSSFAMKAFHDIQALVPRQGPEGGGKPKSRRNR